MSCFVCPKCRESLVSDGKSLVCRNRHCFDISAKGYVNLLLNNKPAEKRHGDDKLMVAARRDFLNAGYYDRLINAVSSTAARLTGDGKLVLDAGCGECKYTDAVAKVTEAKGITVCGIDISKDAVAYGAKRNPALKLAVAGIFSLPLGDSSVGTVLNVFAPDSDTEFHRVLDTNGVLIKVIPLEEHLWELKAAIYDKPVENILPCEVKDGFEMMLHENIKYSFTVSGKDITNLFMMTPYYYKTSRSDQQKVSHIDKLTVTAAFRILVYKKAALGFSSESRM